MKNKILELLGVDKILESIQKLIEVRIALIRNEVEEKIAEKLAKVLPLMLVIFTFSILIMFASITLAFYLSGIFESLVIGFGIVTLFYLIVTIIFYLLKDNKNLKDKFKSEIEKRG